MTTASQIITRAALALGYLGRTEVLSAADANDGLIAFNAMLDSWSNEKLASFVTLQRNFPLVANKQAYTIGSGGDINVIRPLDIVQAFVRDSNNSDYSIDIFDQQRWNAIGSKSITSQIPKVLFYSSQYPLGTINIWPVPLVANTVFYDSTQDQVDPAALTTTLSVPLGYERAYVMNLALELMNAGFPMMLEEKAFAMLVQNASNAKADIKRTNIKDIVQEYDPAMLPTGNRTYNIYRDE